MALEEKEHKHTAGEQHDCQGLSDTQAEVEVVERNKIEVVERNKIEVVERNKVEEVAHTDKIACKEKGLLS